MRKGTIRTASAYDDCVTVEVDDGSRRELHEGDRATLEEFNQEAELIRDGRNWMLRGNATSEYWAGYRSRSNSPNLSYDLPGEPSVHRLRYESERREARRRVVYHGLQLRRFGIEQLEAVLQLQPLACHAFQKLQPGAEDAVL